MALVPDNISIRTKSLDIRSPVKAYSILRSGKHRLPQDSHSKHSLRNGLSKITWLETSARRDSNVDETWIFPPIVESSTPPALSSGK